MAANGRRGQREGADPFATADIGRVIGEREADLLAVPSNQKAISTAPVQRPERTPCHRDRVPDIQVPDIPRQPRTAHFKGTAEAHRQIWILYRN